MTGLTAGDRHHIERFLGMSGGLVLGFSDRTFGEFVRETVGLDIHGEKYSNEGTSKAKKLRAFWKVEPDHVVGALLQALIQYAEEINPRPHEEANIPAVKCRQIAARLLARGARLNPLKEHAKLLNADHLNEQIRRMEAAVETDPSLAIGTAKELIETCCKTILAARGQSVVGTPDISTLTKHPFFLD